MTVFEIAKNYYPKLWNEARIRKLVEAGKLTEAEYEEVTGNPYSLVGDAT